MLLQDEQAVEPGLPAASLQAPEGMAVTLVTPLEVQVSQDASQPAALIHSPVCLRLLQALGDLPVDARNLDALAEPLRQLYRHYMSGTFRKAARQSIRVPATGFVLQPALRWQ